MENTMTTMTHRDYPTTAPVSPSDWLGDWENYNYREAVAASRSTDPEQLVRAVRSAAHSTWENRDAIINRAVTSPAFPSELAAFVFRYWGNPFRR
jgi:hypothetical protein